MGGASATALYERAFDSDAMDSRVFLVTGGAGFIGSHICEYLLCHGAAEVRALDNLSEGKLENIRPWLEKTGFQFIEGDITDPATCAMACANVDYVSHQAALGSVPRSVETPLATNAANVTGFLNILTAANAAGVRRFVYASSSSVYGDSTELPKKEDATGKPLSPYAVSKLVNEIYGSVFARIYGTEVIGLRYFNVFGPRQKPDGPYAAVVPLFMDALLRGQSPCINGDGEQSRDFTFVANVVEANIRAMFTDVTGACDRVYNVACGQRQTINELYRMLRILTGSDVEAAHLEPRTGDVRDSLADISLAREFLGYDPKFDVNSGLAITLDWFRQQFHSTS